MSAAAFLLVAFLGAAPAKVEWKALQAGVTYATIRVADKPAQGDGLFHVVRIDPAVATLSAHASSLDRVEPRTAAEWAKKKKLAVVINAGMFDVRDHRAHSGYFRIEDHTNSKRLVKSYKSAFVMPPARLVDLDAEDAPALEDPDVAFQNLRLIKSPGVNVWKESRRQWSEAAMAMTKGGDILFVFSRTPFTMKDFNAKLLSLGLDVVSAMHMEGGPEASLSIHASGVDLDLCGSYETGFVEDDGNQQQWPIPNVLGVERAAAKK
jgi:hypothetical protein